MLLMRRELRQLRQRIPGILRMHRLTAEEVGRYISFRLNIAGARKGGIHISGGACDAIYQFSGGIPRLINTLCDKVLHRGYLNKERIIEKRMVEMSIHEFSNTPHQSREGSGGLQ